MRGTVLLLLIAAVLLFSSIFQIVLLMGDEPYPTIDSNVCQWEDGSFSFRDPETGCGQGKR